MPSEKRASVGLAMIARDAEHTLGACLDSVRPWIQQIVCCVDELTTDATADVARAHGADVVVPIKVSDWHECEQHGRVLAQHFGQARNESFTYLDASLDAYLWIDADDILDGGEHLAEVLMDAALKGALGSRRASEILGER